MTRKNVIVALIILVIFGFSLWTIVPVDSERLGRDGLRLGLDLVGGVNLVYQADFTENATSSERGDAMDRAVVTIQKRIDKYGVTEPIVQQLGDDRIMVQLPGFTDIEAAKSLVEQTGFLEFREAELDDQGRPVYLSNYLAQDQLQFIDAGETADRIFVQTSNSGGEPVYTTVAFLSRTDNTTQFRDATGNPVDNLTGFEQYGGAVSWIPARGDNGVALTGELLDSAEPVLSQDLAPEPEVSIKWNSEGSVIFDQVAKRLYDPGGAYEPQYLLGIFLDNGLLSAPRVNAQQFSGTAVITGNFNIDEADELANLLNSGSLPMPLQRPPLFQEKISATLGANFIHLSWIAGLVGVLLVMGFMIAYYRLPGLVASIALVIYSTVLLAIFKLWPITLSLAGLGGFIVSIGIAVDANVLIFERMKEEFRMGRSLGAAIEAGFNRAWTAIRDSNITTFIACIILFWLGSSAVASAAVQGFAITLFIGAIISMFTAITVTRTLLRLFIGRGMADKPWLYTVGGGKK
jgi:preprotein translocase subunit SecD